MNTVARTTAILLLALLPLSPAAFASDRHYGGDRQHGHPGYHDRYHAQHPHYRHHHRHHWHRHPGHRYGHHGAKYYGHTGYRVVLPAPPLPVILPPPVVVHKAR